MHLKWRSVLTENNDKVVGEGNVRVLFMGRKDLSLMMTVLFPYVQPNSQSCPFYLTYISVSLI